MLVNAGAPVTSVQALLGHERIDTTVGYTQIYDTTVAAYYYLAMARVEQQLAGPGASRPGVDALQLVALVDTVAAGRLTKAQCESLQALRAGLLGMVEQRAAPWAVLGEGPESTVKSGEMRRSIGGAEYKPGAARSVKVVKSR